MSLKHRSAWFRGLSILTLALVFALFAPGLKTAAKKPSAPGLDIWEKTNIVTYDVSNYLRVWEREDPNGSFKLAWTSARCHDNRSIDLGDVTEDGKKEILGAMSSYGTDEAGGFYQGFFVVYAQGATGTPTYTSEPIGRGNSPHEFIRRVYVANTAGLYDGNEVVLLTDNALAVFKFNGSGFAKIAELSELPEPGTFWDCDVGDLDEDGLDEIAVSVHRDPGEVWIYKQGAAGLVLSAELEISPYAQSFAGSMGQHIRLGDIDGDGRLDVMAYSRKYNEGHYCSYFNTWTWNGAGYDSHYQLIPTGGGYNIFPFDAGDLDGDSRAEVVIEVPIPDGDAVEVWKWNEGLGSFDVHSTLYLGRNIISVSISDFGGGSPRVVMSGANPSARSKDFYLEVFEPVGDNPYLKSLWKFEGSYYRAIAHGND